MSRSLILFVLFIFLIKTTLYSQQSLQFNTIVKSDSLNKETLYDILIDWTSVNFNSANNVIQLSDKENGKIIIKAKETYSFGRTVYNCYDGHLNFTLKIMIKDERYKISIFQLAHNSQYNIKCSLGDITTSELYASKGWGKRDKNKIWNDLKIKSKNLNDLILNSIRLKINNYTKEEKW